MAEILESDIANAEAIIRAFVNENFPTIETREGSAFKSLVITPAATIFALITKELATFNESLNILDIDLTTADESVVEAQLNNFLITRKTGSNASGVLRINVLTARDYTVSENLILLAPDLTQFSPTADTTVAAEDLLSDGETQYFLINVTSVASTSLIITQDTVFTLDFTSFIDPAVSGLVANSDFSQGRAVETITEFRDRAAESITVRNLVTDKAIKSVMKEQFSEILKVTPIGYGDVEMTRDLITPFDIHKGGDVDVYVRSDRIPGTSIVTKVVPEGLLLELIAPEVPILKIESITKLENNLVSPLTEGVDYSIEYSASSEWPSTRFLDQFVAGFAARFSTKELIRITFLDSSLASQAVQITVILPTNIQGFQDFVDQDTQRVMTASLLVRSYCPVFISTNITFKRNVFDQPPDLDVVRTSILDYINGTLGEDGLQVSRLINLVQAADGVNDVDLPLSVTAEVHKTDGSIEFIDFDNELEIDSSKSIGFSQRICQYIAKEEDITFTEVII